MNDSRRSAWTFLAQAAGLAAIYFLASRLGLSMAFPVEQVSAVWPPTGVALAALLLRGPRLWPGVAAGAFVANVLAHEAATTAACIAAGNTLEALAAVWLLRRARFDSSLGRLQDVVALAVLAAGLSTTVSATIGTASLCAAGLHSWAQFDEI